MNFLINIMDYSVKTRVSIAEDTKDPRILAFLSEDSSSKVREAVAKNKFTGRKVINNLSFDMSNRVQAATASNIKLSKENLDRLAKEGDTDTRVEVVKNPNTRNKTREYLSDDKSWEVLVELGRSSFTGIRTLKKLVQKDDYLVVRSAKENPKYK